MEWVDYKDVNMLRKYMSDRGKIRARRVSGNCAQHQRDVALAIKTARELALLPYTQRTTTERPGGRGGRGGGDGGYGGGLGGVDEDPTLRPRPPARSETSTACRRRTPVRLVDGEVSLPTWWSTCRPWPSRVVGR